MRIILVTGGAGFIGANFVHYWRQRHREDGLVILDKLTYAARSDNLEGVQDCLTVRGDICDQRLVRDLLLDHGIDTIVHFAAETHVDRSVSDAGIFVRTNVNGTQALLEGAKAVWLDHGSGRPHRFHHISTDEVFGSLGPGDPAFTEEHRFAPNSPYAASKAAADHLVRAYRRTYGLETTTSNCSNNYGRFQYPEKLIPFFLAQCLLGRPLPIYGDGLNVREWLHVEDHCRGIELILERGRVGESYNLGSSDERTNLAVVNLLCAIVDEAFEEDPDLARRFPDAPAARGLPSSSLAVFVEDRPGHDRRYAMNPAKAQRELDYRAGWTFEEGLLDTVRWYLRNESFWRS